MRMDVSWKRVALILGSLLFPALLTMGGYYLYLQPLVSQVEQVNQEIKMSEKLLAVLQAKEQKVDEVVHDTALLQMQVPVAPLVDQLLLNLEQVEVVSGSLIQSYGFSDEDAAVEDTIEEKTIPKTVELKNPLDEPQAAEPASGQPTDTEPLPEGIKKVTTNLSVTSPNYTQMEQFLTQLEKQKRIMNIDSLSFSGKPEVMNLDGETKDSKNGVNYTIQVSTFYATQLQDLIKDLPYVEYPKPSNRTNPLSVHEVEEEPKTQER